MAGEAPTTLGFADRRTDGRVVVSRSDGEPVAFIARSRVAQRFTAFAPDGSVLCRGRHRHAVSRFMDLRAADGSKMGRVRRGGRHDQVVLRDGRSLRLAVRWFGQGWVLTDPDGTEVISTVRRAASGLTLEQLETGRLPDDAPTILGHRVRIETYFTIGRDDWLVTPDGSLDLAQTVGVVEAYRLLVKAARKTNSAA